MPVLEQEQGFVRQFGGVERAAAGQRMLLRRGQHERFLKQEFRVQLVVVQRQRQQRRIQLAFAQALQEFVALFLDQQQFELREPRAQGRHHVRQQVRAEGGEHAQPQRAGFGIAAATGGLAHLLDIGHDPARALDHLHPGGGQHHLARCAFDQHHAELVLQLADLGGQRGLADEAGVRRLAEVAEISEGHQVLEVAQVHGVASIGATPMARRTTGCRAACLRQAACSSVASGVECRIR